MTRACSRWRTGSCRGSTRCRSATCRTSSLRSMRRSTIRTSRKSTTRRAAASGSGCDDHRAVRDHDAARVRGGRVVAAISRDDHRVVRGGTRDADDRDDRALRVRRALVDPRAARVAGDRDADPAQRASRCVEAQPALLDPRVHRARDLRADRDVRGRDIGRLCLLLGHEGTDLRPGAAVRHGVSPQSRSRRDASRVSAARPAVLRVDDARRATTRLVRRHGVRDSVPDAGDVRDSRRRIQSALRGPVRTALHPQRRRRQRRAGADFFRGGSAQRVARQERRSRRDRAQRRCAHQNGRRGVRRPRDRVALPKKTRRDSAPRARRVARVRKDERLVRNERPSLRIFALVRVARDEATRRTVVLRSLVPAVDCLWSGGRPRPPNRARIRRSRHRIPRVHGPDLRAPRGAPRVVGAARPHDAARAVLLLCYNAQRMTDFIREIVEEDLRTGKHSTVITRFPPAPNGYLHIGHAKSICLNFGVAQEYGGRCNLRFDDTNPEKEEAEYARAIVDDVHWLGFDWGGEPLHASDYFDQLYAWAAPLITRGLAYLDSLSADEIRAHRGTLTEPGKDSPYRGRSVEENLDLFRQMRDGALEDGAAVLRAKIDMASPNINMRDPVLYRIKHEDHHRTGDKWCIYPMYDYAHPPSDAIEHVTHSLCTLEFEDHRPLYDWLVATLPVPSRPRQ